MKKQYNRLGKHIRIKFQRWFRGATSRSTLLFHKRWFILCLIYYACNSCIKYFSDFISSPDQESCQQLQKEIKSRFKIMAQWINLFSNECLEMALTKINFENCFLSPPLNKFPSTNNRSTRIYCKHIEKSSWRYIRRLKCAIFI